MRCTRYLDAVDSREVPAPEHRDSCPDCQEQWLVDQELRQLFQGCATPDLSLTFRHELRQRIAAERRPNQVRRWRLLVMQSYWAAAALACLVILVRLPYPAHSFSPAAVVLLGLVATLALLPVLVLLRSFGVSMLDLIWGTLDRLSSS